MANLPEKNITQVDEITSVPANSKLFVNANGEFRQATVNEVVKSSTVVTSAVENAINTAVEDGVNSHFKQATGSPILLTDTADGTLIDFKGKGRSTQKQYSGKNLLKPTISAGNASGVTFTKNSDGSYTVNGTNTETTEIWQSLGDVILADEDYIVSSGNYGKGAGVFINGSTQTTFDKQSIVSNSDKNKSLKWGIGVKAGVTLNNVIIYPQLEVGTVATDYEPYVGGVASPNPDYPQAIKSVADGGYFDGELLQGAYNGTTGVPVENSYYIRNKNIMPCKPNDTIKLTYAEVKDKLRLFFYKADGTYISKSEVANKDIIEVTAPTDAYYFNFDIVQEISGLTPQTAKPITVTINGKYALIVKSRGKNLFDISKIPNTANMTNNQNGTLTITNSYSNNTYKKLSELTDLKIGQTYTLSFSSTSEHQFIYLSTTSEKWENGMSLKMTQNRLDSAVYFYGNTSGVTTISNIQIEENTVITEYEPYKETVTYIPLNEPLRSSLDGTVKDEVSLTEVNRKFGKFVLNGTENWYFTANANAYISLGGLLKPNGIVISDYYVVNRTKAENTILVNSTNVIIYDKRFATVDEWKAWLAENNVTLIYELAEPIIETIEPVDIVTYDNVTYLTASDNAEMELEYPTSKVAGIASIGYSKGRKAEYEVELLKAQLLELQTAMVNSL